MPPCNVYAVIDGDHFELQIYQRKISEYANTIGHPTVLIDQNGLIVSVSPESKRQGIARLEHIDQARRKFRQLFVIEKERKYGKPDTSIPTKISNEIRSILLKFASTAKEEFCGVSIKIEKNGTDEYFLDLGDFISELLKHRGRALGFVHRNENAPSLKLILLESRSRFANSDVIDRIKYLIFSRDGLRKGELRLAIGALLVSFITKRIEEETEMVFSGGVGVNQLLAKMACKLHKPDAVCAITWEGFDRVKQYVKFTEMTGLGGRLGDRLVRLYDRISVWKLEGELLRDRYRILEDLYQDEYDTALDICRGICYKEIEHRLTTNRVNTGERNLNIFRYSQFESALRRNVRHSFEKFRDEFFVNKRYPLDIKVEYTYGREDFPKAFRLDANTDYSESGAGRLLDEIREIVIRQNSDFNYHLDCGVNSINVQLDKFVQYGEINFVSLVV